MATKAKSTSKTTKKATKQGGTIKVKKKSIPSTGFSLYAPDVNEVYLAGDFNNWQPDAKNFRLRKFKGDIWKKMLKLKPGRYEYQFVVDGQWWCDPENDNRVRNLYCTENCVIEVT
jgi:1,4-alpha-glucan branching enzyme